VLFVVVVIAAGGGRSVFLVHGAVLFDQVL
jgi:hypothetical protein